MPYGIISDVLVVIVGGIIGTALGGRMPGQMKEHMTGLFGCCAMSLGILSVIEAKNMAAVIFSVLAGTLIGLLLHLGDRVTGAAKGLQKLMSRFVRGGAGTLTGERFDAMMLTVIVLFCASGTGIYGVMVEGMTGDHSVLIAKAMLDLFTALIFACSLGAAVCAVAVPQLVIFLILYALAGVIFPYTTPAMIGDFRACGGVLLLATGMRVMNVKAFPVADMIPAMVLVMPLSALWTSLFG